MPLEIIDDRGVPAGLWRQQRLVMRIGQAADVEHEIGIERNAVFVAEGLEQHGQARRIDADEILDPGTQRRRRQVAGVEAVAERAELRQPFALELDRLGQRAIVARKWMPAKGLRK